MAALFLQKKKKTRKKALQGKQSGSLCCLCDLSCYVFGRGHYLGPLALNVHLIVHRAGRWAGVETVQHIPSEGAGGVYPRAAVFTFVKFSQL